MSVLETVLLVAAMVLAFNAVLVAILLRLAYVSRPAEVSRVARRVVSVPHRQQRAARR